MTLFLYHHKLLKISSSLLNLHIKYEASFSDHLFSNLGQIHLVDLQFLNIVIYFNFVHYA